MVLILKNLRQKTFSCKMLHEPFFCCFFIQFKRNDQIRFQGAGELSHHNDWIITEWAGCCRCICVTYNFSSTGFTHISTQTIRFSFSPFTACCGFPFHAVCFFVLQFGIISLQCVHFELCVAIRTLHLLDRTVKGYRTATAGTFIFLQACHKNPPLLMRLSIKFRKFFVRSPDPLCTVSVDCTFVCHNSSSFQPISDFRTFSFLVYDSPVAFTTHLALSTWKL